MTIDWTSSRALAKKEIDFHLAQILQKAKGVVVDIGCGTKPYRSYINSKNYFGLDLKTGDIQADALRLPLKSRSANTILSTQTLEHVNNPQQLINEAYRVLKPKGQLIVTAPMFWPLHDEPHDYWRFTQYSLKLLAQKAGFKQVRIKPLNGFIAASWQIVAILLERPTYHQGFFRKIYALCLKTIFAIIQPLIYRLDQIKFVTGFTTTYLLTAQK